MVSKRVRAFAMDSSPLPILVLAPGFGNAASRSGRLRAMRHALLLTLAFAALAQPGLASAKHSAASAKHPTAPAKPKSEPHPGAREFAAEVAKEAKPGHPALSA